MNTGIGGEEREDFPKENQGSFARRREGREEIGGHSSTPHPANKTLAHTTGTSVCMEVTWAPVEMQILMPSSKAGLKFSISHKFPRRSQGSWGTHQWNTWSSEILVQTFPF